MGITWAYVAGFFDGEGSIRIPLGSGHDSIHLTLTQAGERGEKVLKEIAVFLGTERVAVGFYVNKRLTGKGLQVHRLYAYGDNAVKLLRGMLPYMRVKKLEAQDVLRHRILFPPARGGRYILNSVPVRRTRYNTFVKIHVGEQPEASSGAKKAKRKG